MPRTHDGVGKVPQTQHFVGSPVPKGFKHEGRDGNHRLKQDGKARDFTPCMTFAAESTLSGPRTTSLSSLLMAE